MFIEKILVATDGSDLAVRAAREHACDLIVMGARPGRRQPAADRQRGPACARVVDGPVLALRDPGEASPPEFADVAMT